MSSQKLYYGGNIYSMRSLNEKLEAVLTDNGVIKAFGDYDKVTALADRNAERINIEGRTMLPAFIDAHSHLSMLAQNLSKADLTQAKSFDDIIRILKKFKADNGLDHGEYIVGFGYDENRLSEERHPDKTVLDKVSIENPIFITNVSMHMGCGNSKALESAGITTETDMPKELVGRFPNGEPNGFLAETGMSAVFIQIMNIPLDLEKLYIEAQDEYLRNGICTIQDGAVSAQQFGQLKRLSQDGIFKVDIVAYLMQTDNAHDVLIKNKGLLNKYERHLKIGGYKLVLDGSPQGKTAWLSKPYTDGSSGTVWMKDDDVYYFAKEALDDGVQLLAHCNGDLASQQFLDNYEKAFKSSNDPEKSKLRPVMIHCQTVRMDQLERFHSLNMMLSIFVDHVYYWGDIHLKNLGAERAENISPAVWAEQFDLLFTFHQDTPIISPNMLRTVQTAAERATRSGYILGEKQRISVYDALKAVTINAAYQYGEEKNKGSIDIGKDADFVLLDEDPFEVQIKDISKIKVTETIFKDNILFKL